MSVSILECLENAKSNVENLQKSPSLSPILFPLILGQLTNGIGLLEKGYDPNDDEVEPLIEKYGDLESVPYKF